jgi:cell division septal protein FtsQ
MTLAERKLADAGGPERPRARAKGAVLGSVSMHGMLSATVIILAYVAVAVAAGYAAIKVFRGGPHDG